MERHLDRCQTLIVGLQGLLPADTLNQAQHLLDHGEPSLGVEAVAFATVHQGRSLPAALIDEMEALVLDQTHLPADLADFRQT